MSLTEKKPSLRGIENAEVIHTKWIATPSARNDEEADCSPYGSNYGGKDGNDKKQKVKIVYCSFNSIKKKNK